jgi:isopentenyl phosphate kinase
MKFFCNKYAKQCIAQYIIIDRNLTKESFEKAFKSERNYETLQKLTKEKDIEKYKIENLTNDTIQSILNKIKTTNDDDSIDLLNGLCKGIIRSQYEKIQSLNVPTIIYSDVNTLTKDKMIVLSKDNIVCYYIDDTSHYYPIYGKYADGILRDVYGRIKNI